MWNLLPLCRKEKYYTSCILPQIICGDNFERLNEFLRYLNIDPEYILDSYSTENLLFYTEYSIKESADWEELSEHSSKETPDLVLLIKGKSNTSYQLIVIEAKMFNRTTSVKFREQLNLQKPLIRIMKNKIGIAESNILHIGLLRQDLGDFELLENEILIYWRDILKLYEGYKENYFYQVLSYACNNISASNRLRFTKKKGLVRERNYTGLTSFQDVIRLCEQKGSEILIGFIGGKAALKMESPDQIRKRKYKWDNRASSLGKKRKANWIPGSEFLQIIRNKS